MSFLIEAIVKPSSLQAFAHRPALVRPKCGFENRIKNTFFIRSVSAYRELLIAALQQCSSLPSCNTEQACSIKQHACVQKLAESNTKSVHNRSKPAVFVRTALGLSSNQNEVVINSKSALWRTALGVVHNYRHLWKRTQRTLFDDPLPPPQKRTLKCWFFFKVIFINTNNSNMHHLHHALIVSH